MRNVLWGMAYLTAVFLLSGCADIPVGDMDSLKNYKTPDQTPQQSTYEGVKPSREVDGNGNCTNQATC